MADTKLRLTPGMKGWNRFQKNLRKGKQLPEYEYDMSEGVIDNGKARGLHYAKAIEGRNPYHKRVQINIRPDDFEPVENDPRADLVRRGGVMKNHEVATCIVDNALAYAKQGDMDTVLHNLEYIKMLLEKPNEENKNHAWGDFK